MRTLVLSLKRLYKTGKVTLVKLNDLIRSGTITAEEYNYIIND